MKTRRHAGRALISLRAGVDIASVTPEEIAEALERARYEGLRGSVWTDLREGERNARVDVATRALEQTGVTALLADLTTRADRSAELDGLLAQRDAEIGRRISEHEAELAELRSERDDAVAGLEQELATLRLELDETRAHAAAADTRAKAAETVVAAVRSALGDPVPVVAEDVETAAISVAEGGADAPEPTEDDAAERSRPLVTRMVPSSRFGRLAKADRR